MQSLDYSQAAPATARAVRLAALDRTAAAARSRLSHGEARMSNNPNWKRQLQDKINEHNRQHGRKPKGVSNKTMHERACSLFRSFTLLRRLGYQIDPDQPRRPAHPDAR